MSCDWPFPPCPTFDDDRHEGPINLNAIYTACTVQQPPIYDTYSAVIHSFVLLVDHQTRHMLQIRFCFNFWHVLYVSYSTLLISMLLMSALSLFALYHTVSYCIMLYHAVSYLVLLSDPNYLKPANHIEQKCNCPILFNK